MFRASAAGAGSLILGQEKLLPSLLQLRFLRELLASLLDALVEQIQPLLHRRPLLQQHFLLGLEGCDLLGGRGFAELLNGLDAVMSACTSEKWGSG